MGTIKNKRVYKIIAFLGQTADYDSRYIALNHVVALIRQEGLARVLEYRNSSRITLFPSSILEIVEVWDSLLEDPNRFEQVYRHHQKAASDTGLFYCLLDLLYLSEVKEQIKLTAGSNSAPLSSLNSFLHDYCESMLDVRQGKFWVEGITPEMFNHFTRLQQMDLFEFVRFSTAIVQGLGVEKGFNPFAYLPDVEKVCKLRS
mgnify:FL=1